MSNGETSVGSSQAASASAPGEGRLTGRVAIVTGAAQGLGKAYADRLLRAGACVALWDVATDPLAEATAELTDTHGADRILSTRTDVTEEGSVQSALEQVLGQWARVTVLVNNAGGGLFPAGPTEKMTVEQFTRVMGVNVTGAWLCSREVLPHMRAEGYGKIINVTSTMVTSGLPTGLVAYTTAKAGIVGLTRSMAREIGPDGIRVNALAPGYVPIRVTGTLSADTRNALLEQMKAEQSIPTILKPEDLCGTVEYLSSQDSDMVTGQVINVSGGWVFN